MKQFALLPYVFTLLKWATIAGLIHFLRSRRNGRLRLSSAGPSGVASNVISKR